MCRPRTETEGFTQAQSAEVVVGVGEGRPLPLGGSGGHPRENFEILGLICTTQSITTIVVVIIFSMTKIL
jgi:hypothetical protein